MSSNVTSWARPRGRPGGAPDPEGELLIIAISSRRVFHAVDDDLERSLS
jgi:hypothetical protein